MENYQDQPPTSDSHAVRFQLALSTTARKISVLINEKLEEGLTGPQGYILKLIFEQKRATASMLAEKLQVKPSAITVMIDRLVQHGFVRRLADEQDRRVTLLLLTEKGSMAIEKMIMESRDILNRLLYTLEPSEIEQFVNHFERIALATSTLEG